MSNFLKNAQIVRDLPKLKLLKEEKRSVEIQHELLTRQLAALAKQNERLKTDVETLDSVTEIYKGVAICAVDDDTDHWRIDAVGYDIPRRAEVYVNANSLSDYGIHLIRTDGPAWGVDRDWLGVGWSKRDALTVAKEWIATGTKPSADFQNMCTTRHRLHPRASKLRRDAYEAAWLAGKHEFAEQILVVAKRPTPKKRARKATCQRCEETRP
jgi:hypothetical protein